MVMIGAWRNDGFFKSFRFAAQGLNWVLSWGSVWILVSVLLTGCFDNSGGAIADTHEPEPPVTPLTETLPQQASPAANQTITSINDPLMSRQWIFYNPDGADIAAFAEGVGHMTTQPADYAYGMMGRGVTVAVVDSGLQIDHPDLVDNLLVNGSYNFAYPHNGFGRYDPSNSTTKGDHGTSVAGIIGARGGNESGLWGVAPAVQLKGFNFLSANNDQLLVYALGREAGDILPGLRNQDVDVFNLSFGSQPTLASYSNQQAQLRIQAIHQQLKDASQFLREGRGAIYVKAAGNEYKKWGSCRLRKSFDLTCFNVNLEQEHATPFQILVGAFNKQGKRASYSNTGSALWISAPGGEDGQGIVTTDQTGCSRGHHLDANTLSTEFDKGRDPLNADCSYSESFTGTSAATPIVSGLVALMLEANPKLSWRDVKHILATSTQPLQNELQPISQWLSGERLILEQGWITNQADSAFLTRFGRDRQQQAGGYAFSNALGFGGVHLRDAVAMAQDWALRDLTLPDFKEVAFAMHNPQAEIPNTSIKGAKQIQTLEDDLLIAETVKIKISIQSPDQSSLQGEKPIDIKHYLVRLTSPQGTQSILLNPYHGLESGYDLIDFSMVSHAFYGERAKGDWLLEVINVKNDYTSLPTPPSPAVLTSWQMTIFGHQQ
jgi:subtilisin-like proprotein convertase family protein